MEKKHDIEEKVQALREERDMVQYESAIAGGSEKINPLVKKTINQLQKEIFTFDEELESGEYGMSELYKKHDTLITSLTGSLMKIFDTEIAIEDALKDLKEFFEAEFSIRAGGSPINYEIQEFYDIKCCDVFINRKVIEKMYGITMSDHEATIIETFDNVGEVLDDIEDVQEDIEAINANRFLVAGITHGRDLTTINYSAYLSERLEILHMNKDILKKYGLDIKNLKKRIYEGIEQDFSFIRRSVTTDMLSVA